MRRIWGSAFTKGCGGAVVGTLLTLAALRAVETYRLVHQDHAVLLQVIQVLNKATTAPAGEK